MGNLLSSARRLPERFVDLDQENQPSEAESNVISGLRPINFEDVFNKLSNYHAHTAEINGIASYSDERAQEVYENTKSNVQFLSDLYDFCETATNNFVALVNYLMKSDSIVTMRTLNRNKHITKVIVDYMTYVMEIDRVKMSQPNILMDLSFYRRTTQRNMQNAMNDQLYTKSGQITLFLGESTPFYAMLYKETNSRFATENEKLTKLFGFICNNCGACLQAHHDSANKKKWLSAMTVSFLVIDHSCGNAYNKRNAFAPIRCLEQMFNQPQEMRFYTDSLKYNSKHLEDKGNFRQIKNMFA